MSLTLVFLKSQSSKLVTHIFIVKVESNVARDQERNDRNKNYGKSDSVD